MMREHAWSSMRKSRSGARAFVLVALAAVLAFQPFLSAAVVEREMLLFQDIPDFVTATKVKQPITEAPASATVFTDEQLKRMGARTLADALRTVAGVYVSGTD
ncbi:MAG: TonB-dependent receptor plug domain-containing protein, partial [Endomicrobiales bacterium]